jgi:superfamily II DNA or RNA helicase
MAENIILRDYQHESFKFLNSDFEKLVLAMCPSSGKTETVIYYIDQIFKQKKDLKVLILPHSTNVLLNNFYDRLENRNVNFTYSTDISVNCNVHIVLPQNKAKIKDEYDLLIVDEAHENYFANTIQDIIIKTKPKKQILLTGTPYQFIGMDDFKIHFLALNELDKNIIPKLRVDIIESNYQWNGNYNSYREVKKQFDFNDDDTKTTLDKTFKFILNRNNNAIKSVSKTLIVCNNIKQSEFVKSYLDSIGLYSVLSNSKNDIKSSLVQDFKHNKINILIVVNRARLGYDDIDLINLIDMSGTLNPNLIYQMVARVLRGSNDIQKYYIRLTSKKDESLNSEIATNLAFMLTDKKYISAFNGKNFNSQKIIVPNNFTKKYISTSSNFIENSPKLLVSTDDVISFYRDTISDIDKENGVYKFCDVKDVLNELGGTFREKRSFERCKESASKFKSRNKWQEGDRSSYDFAMKNKWLDECCKHMIPFFKSHTLESCKEIASKFNTRTEWQNVRGGSYSYALKKGWLDECCKHMIPFFKGHTLESCKESASKFNTRTEWFYGDNSSYLYANKKGWSEECCKNMREKPKIYNLDDVIKIASKYQTIKEFRKSEPNVYSYVKRKKIQNICCTHMKSSRNRNFEDCLIISSKYKSEIEFKKNDFNVYMFASKRGWLDKLCKNMTRIKRGSRSLEYCIKDASLYKTSKDWYKSSTSCYNWASRNRWLDECSKHFKK